MTRLIWDETGTRFFETGVDRGVFYPEDGSGVPWNGLSAVEEAPSDSDISINHIDGIKYRSRVTRGVFSATLQAYTYPEVFELYDGQEGLLRHQRRRYFGLSYRTAIGNDTEGVDLGHQIHIVYNAMTSPSPAGYETLSGGSLTPIPFSWKLSTIPISIPGAAPSSHIILDTRFATELAIQSAESILYGSDDGDPRLPSPQELIDTFENSGIVVIIDHGDGTWTAVGPDDIIRMVSDDEFEITWPSAVYLTADTYQISTL